MTTRSYHVTIHYNGHASKDDRYAKFRSFDFRGTKNQSRERKNLSTTNTRLDMILFGGETKSITQ